MRIRQIGAEREDAMPTACEVKNGKGPTFEAGAFSIRTPSCVVCAGGIVEGRSRARRWFPTLARFVSAGSEPKVIEGA